MADKKAPWEQPIFEENNSEDAPSSRSEKRHNKKGDTVFITILVLLLLAIAALLAFMFTQGKKPLDTKSPVEITETTSGKDKQAAKDKAAKEQAAKDKAAKEQAAKDKAAKEQAAKDKAEKEQAAKDKAEKEQAAKETTEATTEVTTQETTEATTEVTQENVIPEGATHIVQEGDTPYKIASANGISYEELVALNPELANPTGMQIGQVVKLK